MKCLERYNSAKDLNAYQCVTYDGIPKFSVSSENVGGSTQQARWTQAWGGSPSLVRRCWSGASHTKVGWARASVEETLLFHVKSWDLKCSCTVVEWTHIPECLSKAPREQSRRQDPSKSYSSWTVDRVRDNQTYTHMYFYFSGWINPS